MRVVHEEGIKVKLTDIGGDVEKEGKPAHPVEELRHAYSLCLSRKARERGEPALDEARHTSIASAYGRRPANLGVGFRHVVARNRDCCHKKYA